MPPNERQCNDLAPEIAAYVTTQPVPPPKDANGSWVYRTCAGNSTWVWVEGGATALPSPAQLAQEAFQQLRPPAPTIDFAPRYHPSGGEATLVGLKTFVWLAAGGTQPITRRAAAGPNFAQVTAKVQTVTIDPGDGSPAVMCGDGGTPYDPAVSYAQQTSDCWHIYQRASSAAGFTLRVTVVWGATWVGNGGAGGVLPAVNAAAAVQVPVQEMQVVNS